MPMMDGGLFSSQVGGMMAAMGAIASGPSLRPAHA
jgi:hypothetical protein